MLILGKKRKKYSYLDRIKNDPVLYEQYKERKRQYYYKQKLKLIKKDEESPPDSPKSSIATNETEMTTGESIQPEELTEIIQEETDFHRFIRENFAQLNVDLENITEIDILRCKQIYVGRKSFEHAKLMFEFPPIEDDFEEDFETTPEPLIKKEPPITPQLPDDFETKMLLKKIKTQEELVNKLKRRLADNNIPLEEIRKEPTPPSEPCIKRKKKYRIKEKHNVPDLEFPKTINEFQISDEKISDTEVDLKNTITDFLHRDDVCSIATENNVDHPFLYHVVLILHQRFVFEENIECSLNDFIKNIPQDKLYCDNDDTNRLGCLICINPDLKLSKLKEFDLIESNISFYSLLNDDDYLTNVYEQLDVYKESLESVTYNTCVKGEFSIVKKTLMTSISVLIEKFKDEIQQLKKHVHQVVAQYRAARTCRKLALETDFSATIHLELLPRVKIYQTHNQSGVISSDKTLLLHNAVIYSKNWSKTSSNLSDSKDMSLMSFASWVFIHKILEMLIKENMKKIYIISNGTSYQYKNKTSFYLAKLFAQEHNVEIRWVYLDTSHIHGPATRVGREVKETIEHLTASRPASLCMNSSDVLDLVRSHLDLILYCHDDEEVNKWKDMVPYLLTIPGSFNFKEVFINEKDLLYKYSSLEEYYSYAKGRMMKFGNSTWNSKADPENDIKISPRLLIPKKKKNANTEILEDMYNTFNYEVDSPSNIEIVTNE